MNRRLITALAIVGILGTGGAAMAVNASVLSAASVDPGNLGSATTVLDDVTPTPTNTAPEHPAGADQGDGVVVSPDEDGVSPGGDGSPPVEPGDDGTSGGDDGSDRPGDSDDSGGSDEDSDGPEDDD